MANYPYRSNYNYQTPLRRKTGGLLAGLFAGLGAEGETTVEDEARRRKFILEHPELQSDITQGPGVGTDVAPTFMKPKSNFRDFFSGGQGSAAANQYNMRSLLGYDEFQRAKALDEFNRQQATKFALANAPRANPYVQPGQVPPFLGDITGDYSTQGVPFDPNEFTRERVPFTNETLGGLEGNARVAEARAKGINAANASLLQGLGIPNIPGSETQVGERLTGPAISTAVQSSKTAGQRATEENVKSKQITSKYLREPGFISRGLDLQQALQEKALESQSTGALTPGVHLINGQLYTVTEGIDPNTAARTYKVTDSSGRPVSGIIPLSTLRSASSGGVNPYSYQGPRSKPSVENRITAPFDQDLGTTPPLASPPSEKTAVPQDYTPRSLPVTSGGLTNIPRVAPTVNTRQELEELLRRLRYIQ